MHLSHWTLTSGLSWPQLLIKLVLLIVKFFEPFHAKNGQG